jgi:GrpB-like predicted nucleotidyltransferase (UPF0157 family)
MREIVIVDYDPKWPELFAVEAAGISEAFGLSLLRLEHIGSTSVPGLAAKPIVDIQAVVRSVLEAQKAASALAEIGWRQGVFDLDPERRLYFKKENAEGVRTHQLHVYAPDHPSAAEHLLFRDYLRRHPGEVTRYLDLKRQLVEAHQYNGIAYSLAKTEYVASVLAKARGE